ncbi:MAG: aldehyde dehydrogenase (NADP(+)) [Saprospiraceae bacterium]
MNTFYAINPVNNERLEGEFSNSTKAEINEAVQKATTAFDIYRKKDNNDIADFLNQIAAEILDLGDALLERCHLETALPLGRLRGERGRTMNQLKLFAELVREGSWADARIDTAIPDRKPFPKSDIRHILQPLGAVAVFGASNFPLAFSVAGGDTASALAAGCPVVLKGHPAHPGTCEMVASAFQKAIEKCNMPDGVFSLVQGNTHEVGQNLVKHSDIKAVGFTGSFRGGKALFDLANARPEPIPVFAEMGSTNPVFILPNALKEKGEAIAQGMSNSITLGVGQFCTNPGLTFVENAENTNEFSQYFAAKMAEKTAETMLTPNIKTAYDNGIQHTTSLDGITTLATGQNGNLNHATPQLFQTSIKHFLENQALAEENFGPSSILVVAETKSQILEAAKSLEGHLTATVHGTPEDFENYKALFDILEQKVGRIVINGYPTGVEVCHSMVHGGPFPATTAPQSTSVGTNAIKRFVRPICFQDYPETLLPKALHNNNPMNIWRLINGEWTKDSVV